MACKRWGGAVLAILLTCACTLQEIRNKNSGGPEWRTKGAGDDKSHSVLWYVSEGLDFEWDNGVTTGVNFRRRDEDGGSGQIDNGLFFEVSFPLWKKPKPAPKSDDPR